MSRRWVLAAASAATVLGVSGVGVAAAPPVISDPPQNASSSANHWPACADDGADSQACTDAVVASIDDARALEGVGPMHLPPGFGALPTAEQTFVVSNLERVDRALPPVVGMVASLNRLANDAADADTDPVLPSWSVGNFRVSGWSSIWAGDLNAVAADYDWMYNDGWSASGSPNLDCATPQAAGCWGHRHAILAPGDQLITGVGSARQARWTSIAQIVVAGSGSYPDFTYSWADVTGDPVNPAPTATRTAGTEVSAHSWRTSAGRGAIAADVTPAEGQPVRLRRLTSTGLRTVRRATAGGALLFPRVPFGRYRVIVAATPETPRAVARVHVG